MTAQFSETVTGFDSSDVVVSNGSISGFTAVDGDTYTFTITALVPGTVTVSVPADRATDLATTRTRRRNTLSWIYDNTPPTVVLSGGGSGTTNTAAFRVTAQFSETVTGFDSSDVVVSNGSISGFTAVDGDTYTFTITALVPGTVTVSVPANRASDLAGNQNTASNTLSWIYLGGYTVQYLQPLDESTVTPAHPVVNEGKNGRVIPVKVTLTLSGVQQTNSQIADGRLTIRVNAASCNASVPIDPVETYADAGASNGNTDIFRYTGGSWIYNLDTKALGLATGNCYRLDVYLDGNKISTQTYAIFKPVK